MRISRCEFARYRLSIRYSLHVPVVELPHRTGKLFQQYIVDQYARIELERLDWIRRNQAKLRAGSVQELMDHLGTDCNIAQAGKRILLPFSFGGSPRHLHECYLDAMAIVAAYGRPGSCFYYVPPRLLCLSFSYVMVHSLLSY